MAKQTRNRRFTSDIESLKDHLAQYRLPCTRCGNVQPLKRLLITHSPGVPDNNAIALCVTCVCNTQAFVSYREELLGNISERYTHCLDMFLSIVPDLTPLRCGRCGKLVKKPDHDGSMFRDGLCADCLVDGSFPLEMIRPYSDQLPTDEESARLFPNMGSDS